MMAIILFSVPLLGQTVKVLAHRCSTCGIFQKKFGKIVKILKRCLSYLLETIFHSASHDPHCFHNRLYPGPMPLYL